MVVRATLHFTSPRRKECVPRRGWISRIHNLISQRAKRKLLSLLTRGLCLPIHFWGCVVLFYGSRLSTALHRFGGSEIQCLPLGKLDSNCQCFRCRVHPSCQLFTNVTNFFSVSIWPEMSTHEMRGKEMKNGSSADSLFTFCFCFCEVFGVFVHFCVLYYALRQTWTWKSTCKKEWEGSEHNNEMLIIYSRIVKCVQWETFSNISTHLIGGRSNVRLGSSWVLNLNLFWIEIGKWLSEVDEVIMGSDTVVGKTFVWLESRWSKKRRTNEAKFDKPNESIKRMRKINTVTTVLMTISITKNITWYVNVPVIAALKLFSRCFITISSITD